MFQKLSLVLAVVLGLVFVIPACADDDGPSSAVYTMTNADDGTVSIYQLNSVDDSLASLGAIGGLPDNGSAVGIAARSKYA